MTRTLSFRHRPRGFTLIEVMIAVLVLATGFLALTALQGALIRSSADSKTRSQIATYAASELDRYRLEGTIVASGTFPADPTGNDVARAAYAAGVSELRPAVTVTQYVLDPASGNFVVNAGSPGDNAYFKRVTLNMGWTDATGDSTRSLVFVTDVSPLALTASKILVDRVPPDDQGLRPIVRRPTPLTEGMIPIALGTGQDTAATNPKPVLVGRNNDTLVADTSFDLLTFNATDNLGVTGYVRFDKRLENRYVGCTCQMGLTGFPTGGSAPAFNSFLRAKAFRPSYWDGTTYVTPRAAPYTPGRSPENNVPQSQLCDVCCRDHEDGRTGTTGPKFNPWVADAHEHYLDPAGSPVTSGSGSFKEACRVMRINGEWRVTPDPKTQDIALVPTNVHPITAVAPSDNSSATSPLVSGAGRTSYVQFAYDFVKKFFYDGTYADTDAYRRAMHATAGLNQPEYVPIKAGDKRWLHARAIQTDYLEPAAVARINKAKSECTAPSPSTGQPEYEWRAQCVLPYAPMAPINTTEQATWNGKAASETGIVLTGTLLTSITSYGQAMLNRFVSALALIGPISPQDDDSPIKDEQTFALVPPATRAEPWLSVASPTGVLFGDATDPSRGFATISGGTRFNIQLNGLPYASDRAPANDPNVNIGVTAPQPCNPSNPTLGGNPFVCTTDSTTNVVVAVGKFNYLETTNGNLTDPCDGVGKIGEGQAVCRAYSLTGGTLVSGTTGKPSEVRSVTLATVTAGSTQTLTFTAGNTVNATEVCSASNQWTGWACP